MLKAMERDGKLAGAPAVFVGRLTIKAGESLSTDYLDVQRGCICVIRVPSTFTGSELTFEATSDASDFGVLENDEGEVLKGVTAGRPLQLQPSDIYGHRYLKVRSGTAAVPTAQASDAEIELVIKAL